MAAFTEEEIDHRCPDVRGILEDRGIFSVLEADVDPLCTWLIAKKYRIHTVDCRLGLLETRRQLGELLRWEEQFGYRMETGKGSLDALRDGFEFPAVPGGRIALLVLEPAALLSQRSWLLGLLSIASEHSTYHLALGSRFMTIVSLSKDSPLVRAHFEVRGVTPPWPLQLPGAPRTPRLEGTSDRP